ncbi:MAG: hypothetical protein ACU85U_08850 [Gammaproteobacteria bacterium]|jgi:hypothetical protein
MDFSLPQDLLKLEARSGRSAHINQNAHALRLYDRPSVGHPWARARQVLKSCAEVRLYASIS